MKSCGVSERHGQSIRRKRVLSRAVCSTPPACRSSSDIYICNKSTPYFSCFSILSASIIKLSKHGFRKYRGITAGDGGDERSRWHPFFTRAELCTRTSFGSNSIRQRSRSTGMLSNYSSNVLDNLTDSHRTGPDSGSWVRFSTKAYL